jgi:hypothetical protein
MKKNREPKLLQVVFTGVGLAVFVFFARNFDARQLFPAAFLVSCIVLAEFIDVYLPQGEPVSVSSAFVIFSLLWFKLPEVMVISGVGLLLAALVKQDRANALGVLRPVAAISLQVFVAAFAFKLLGGEVGAVKLSGIHLLSLAALTIVYFGLKALLEQFFATRARRLSYLPSLLGTITLLSPTYLALACTGILMALMYGMMSYWGILLFFLPLLVTRHSFKLYMDIKQTYQSTISALAAAIEAQDDGKKGHARRVARHSLSIGRELGLRGRQLEMLGYAALLHDIGTLGFEGDDLEGFLDEQGLDLEDGEPVHASKGAEILEQVDYLKGISGVVRRHHTPYACSKSGNGTRIPLASRIINVASFYDDLAHTQEGVENNVRRVIGRIKAEQGARFDPRVVRAFTNVLRRRGKLVILF